MHIIPWDVSIANDSTGNKLPYGNERLTVERFDGWTGYYTYDPRGSVSGVTGSDGYLWQSYRYDPFGDISFGTLCHAGIRNSNCSWD